MVSGMSIHSCCCQSILVPSSWYEPRLQTSSEVIPVMAASKSSRKESQEKLKLKVVYILPSLKFSTPPDQFSSEGYLYSTCIHQHPRLKGLKVQLQRPCNSSCSSLLTLLARKCQLREVHTGLEANLSRH